MRIRMPAAWRKGPFGPGTGLLVTGAAIVMGRGRAAEVARSLAHIVVHLLVRRARVRDEDCLVGNLLSVGHHMLNGVFGVVVAGGKERPFGEGRDGLYQCRRRRRCGGLATFRVTPSSRRACPLSLS